MHMYSSNMNLLKTLTMLLTYDNCSDLKMSLNRMRMDFLDVLSTTAITVGYFAVRNIALWYSYLNTLTLSLRRDAQHCCGPGPDFPVEVDPCKHHNFYKVLSLLSFHSSAGRLFPHALYGRDAEMGC